MNLEKNKIDLRTIKTYKEFEEKLGDRNANYELVDKWNRERLKIGGIYFFDATHFTKYSELKRYHMKKCKLLEVSKILNSFGYVLFENGKKESVNLEYLIESNDDSFVLKSERQKSLFSI